MPAGPPPRLRQRQLLGRLEHGLLVVEDGDALLELVRQPLPPRVVADQPLGALLVRHDADAADPDHPLGPLGQRHHGAGEAGLRSTK